MYQVLARKWRPTSFEELVGQQHVTRTLANAIRSNRLAHAYIFAGVRGTGKTSAARILARCLNCEHGPTLAPCGACPPCLEIADTRCMDVLELDAASRTGVDDIRELQEVVSYPPVRDRYKLLIIDEAQMLSKQAFNALLKTLEEPPPRVVFVLATTELQKILPTVLSRCQVFQFRRVSPKETSAHLRRVCEQEGIRISDAALERIARAGEGSVRDALSLVERVIAFCGRAVEDQDVLRLLGAVPTETLAAMIGAMARRDAAAMVSALDGLVEEGHDLVQFWGELVGALRDLLLLRATEARASAWISRSEDDVRQLARAAEGLTREDLTRIFQIVAELEPGLKSSAQPRYLFEATLVRIASLGAVRPIEELLAALGPGRAAPADSSAGGDPRGGGGGRPHGPGVPGQGRPREATPAGDAEARVSAAVRRERPMLAAILDAASSIRLEDGVLRVAFPAAEEALGRQLERSANAEALARCAREVIGRDVRLAVSVDGPAASTGLAPRSASEEERASRDSPHPRPDRDRLLRQATSDPGVQRLLAEFGAQVIDIRPLGAAAPDGEAGPPGQRTEKSP